MAFANLVRRLRFVPSWVQVQESTQLSLPTRQSASTGGYNSSLLTLSLRCAFFGRQAAAACVVARHRCRLQLCLKTSGSGISPALNVPQAVVSQGTDQAGLSMHSCFPSCPHKDCVRLELGARCGTSRLVSDRSERLGVPFSLLKSFYTS